MKKMKSAGKLGGWRKPPPHKEAGVGFTCSVC